MDVRDINTTEIITALVAQEPWRQGINIAALQETRLAETDKLTKVSAGLTFYWIGYIDEVIRIREVGFAIAKDFIPLLVEETHEVNARV